ncbi:DEAD/DEAH box helicase [Alteromonas lipolytica]|uniref:RNA helicase n=1 Tax=Alteromonas lipolytica TaxID=1856405 RepID=A0A1E8FI19_9ALTE|nr:DEAD/DEAH box helicase [Alteromonas lipolytica]OFI35123.1 RNA helicase [Alteromonas lipolytica]GGF56876.1 RNA helicase [Alteromonas lipolytica]
MLITDLPVHHTLVSRIQDKGFTELTEVQEKTILPALLGKDIIASSKTGSGKTLAFLIPVVHRLLTQKALSRQDPRVLILAPTRELAKQVFGEAKWLCQKKNLATALVVGGDNYNDQAKALRRNPHIIVGTPGRIADHLEDKSFFINGLEMLIFDEADRMLDLGFAKAISLINNKADHRKRQTMLFSATMDHVELNMVLDKLLKAPVRVAIGSATAEHTDITQTLYFAESIEHKDALLCDQLENNTYNQAIVFTATRDDAERISTLLETALPKRSSKPLRGDYAQSKRSLVMNEFARGQFDILVTTDVASRGLDLSKVGLVINYDMPKHPEEYIHRIGRTGRAGNRGAAVSFVGKRDWQSFTALKAQLAYPLEPQQHETLASKFTGIKHKPVKPKKAVKAKKGDADAADKPVKKTQRVRTMTGDDIGHMPMRKKPRNTDESED